jgi:hypothetical protein
LSLLDLTVPLSMARPSHLGLVLLHSVLHIVGAPHFIFEKAEKVREALIFVGIILLRILKLEGLKVVKVCSSPLWLLI